VDIKGNIVVEIGYNPDQTQDLECGTTACKHLWSKFACYDSSFEVLSAERFRSMWVVNPDEIL
jgi:hypothetical protein